MQDFSGKFEDDFNFLENFFWRDFLLKIEVDFFLYCPLPYSLPLGSSANLTARRFLPSWSWYMNKCFRFFCGSTLWSLEARGTLENGWGPCPAQGPGRLAPAFVHGEVQEGIFKITDRQGDQSCDPQKNPHWHIFFHPPNTINLDWLHLYY